jgi:hemerythrin-like metal-binding protein
MALITWSNEYCVNIDDIDEEHQELINLINNLEEAYQAWQANIVDHSLFRWYFNEFAMFMNYHFQTEERIFKERNYSHLEYHRDEYDKLSMKLLDAQKNLAKAEMFAAEEIMNFITHWLNQHILYILQMQTQVQTKAHKIQTEKSRLDVLDDFGEVLTPA